MKKIIHMSDPHIGYRDSDERMNVTIDHLCRVIHGNPCHYVVVITGDLVNNAWKHGSYDQALAILDRLKAAGFHHILVIPGNHDYGTGNRGSHQFVRRFKESFFGRPDLDYPKVDILGETAFIGLDSMANEVQWYRSLWAQGQIGNDQLNRLKEILERKRIRECSHRVIYLHHHPFKWRPLHELKDSRKLKTILSQAISDGVGIDALLFGHNHEGKAHNGMWGIPRCYDAGTATMKSRSPYIKWSPWFRIRSSSRIIDLTQGPDEDFIVPCYFEE